jgi:hypothetical protein
MKETATTVEEPKLASAKKAAQIWGQAKGVSNAPQQRRARPPKGGIEKDDRSKALAVLALEGVTEKLRWTEVKQAGLLFKGAQDATEERAAIDAANLHDLTALRKAISSVKLRTESGKRLQACLLRDFDQGTVTIEQVRRGVKAVPLLPKNSPPRKGRPIDVGIDRVIRDFKAVHGWSWQVCAAAVFLSGVSTYDYHAIKKSFRDWAQRHRTRA